MKYCWHDISLHQYLSKTMSYHLDRDNANMKRERDVSNSMWYVSNRHPEIQRRRRRERERGVITLH